jgi:excinuclease ABC subunit A
VLWGYTSVMINEIKIRGANVHNLKNVSLELPRNKLIIFTGLSGSGKSSLAFDTIYAEGQRRYMESLSSYARQFLDQMDKPDVESIEGLSPAISIDQKQSSHNPRSTVGTVTEIYDYIRLLYGSIGIPHCPSCNTPIHSMSVQEMVERLFQWEINTKVIIFSPVVTKRKGEHKDILDNIQKQGYSRVYINGEFFRLTDSISLDKNKFHSIDIVVDRVKITEENRSRIFQSVESAISASNGLVRLENLDASESVLFSEQLSCPACDVSIEELSPRLFSFNSPLGACASCNGLGDIKDFDPHLVVEKPRNPLKTCTGKVINLEGTYYGKSLNRFAKSYGFDLETPFNELSESQKNIFLYGQETAVEDNPYITHSHEDYGVGYGQWEGVITNLRRRYFQTRSEGMRFFFRSYMSAKTCQSCEGSRLRPTARSVLMQGHAIHDLMALNVASLLTLFESMIFTEKEQEIVGQVTKEILKRLVFLKNVGLDYLTLDRKATTLSGGEFQRIRLATQIGAGLTGVLYVLDEPSIGLHQRDNERLIQTLKHLRDLGNTVIVVEHDEETIREADYIVDIGPGAGRLGGNITFSGDQAAFKASDVSVTAKYVYGKTSIPIPKKRRSPKGKGELTLLGAEENNLKCLDVTFPLGRMIGITGVSGSGKSSLIHDVLHKALMRHFHKSKERPGKHKEILGLENIDKLITIDQSPIGRTPRSNPATYTGVFTPLRELFSQTREAKIRGYKPGRFSFNVRGGRCEACQGDGVLKIEMHFLSDVYIECDVCKGKRYNQETLEVRYKGHSISDILRMTVNEASELFDAHPAINSKLKTLQDVGLGYIHLGQNATTLSGGEAQRIKLAKELSKLGTGKTLYLLDEPTTGLHFEDIKLLLSVFDRLVNAGNTIIVIEHNLDVIKTVDHIIDIGPEGGDKGGRIVAQGTPEQIAEKNGSHTGKFLKKVLHSHTVSV